MEIYLIRHTTPLVTKGMIYGRRDVPLADSFLEEKEEMLKQLPPAIEAVYSSPSSRCTQLAAAISTVYTTDAALQELNFGDWEGQTWDTVDRVASDAWMNDFVRLSPPNGETMLEMEQRIFQFWKGLLQQPFGTVAVVTHGGVIRIILAHYRAVLLKDAFSIPVRMAGVFRLSVSSL
ncbi:alpha-ribazole phosphatase [Pedobacter hartonius]|uniref:Alpha-ribazole phosphatase n=1 Tax=Pedobacter hartonius TaxID=425514 RepID=A0A1H4AQV8_9SPHI|nr:alpha-ribazole phosphatase [Pedobacter hartonius]SEA38309.1 alpha-ribazole phosphatase [Pedobacter hartonius]